MNEEAGKASLSHPEREAVLRDFWWDRHLLSRKSGSGRAKSKIERLLKNHLLSEPTVLSSTGIGIGHTHAMDRISNSTLA